MNPLDNLVKVWRKMKLWEISACGIPMYPKAHKSFSLIKALEGKSDELNLEKKSMEDSKKPEEVKEDSESESKEDAPEKPEKKPEEAEPKEAPAVQPGESEAEKSVSTMINKKLSDLINQKVEEQMKDFMEKAFSDAIKVSKVPRGLVSEEEPTEKAIKAELDKKSIGELAVMSGLFQKPAEIGSVKRFE